MKILIVDDEPLVRLGMKSIIPWEEQGYTIVGEAGNGLQGLEMLQQLKPDLVLVDIKMPIMDGLTLIEKAKERRFKGKFIILTCISEIEYLQKAIQLGVSRYILKNSVNPDEILNTVNELSLEMRNNSMFNEYNGDTYNDINENYALNEFLNLVFKGIITNTEQTIEKLKVFGFNTEQYTEIISIRIRSKEETYSKKLYQLTAIGKSLIEEIGFGCCFINFEDYLIMLVQCESGNTVNDMMFRFKASMKQYFDVKISYSRMKVDLQDCNIFGQYLATKNEIENEFFRERYKDEKTGSLKVNMIPATEYASYEKLSSTLSIMKDMVLRSQVISENEVKKFYEGTIDYVMLMHELDASEILPDVKNKQQLRKKIDALESMDEIHSVTLNILKECYRVAGMKGYTEYSDELIDAMTQYIHKHYKDKISTKDVAQKVHFSVDYSCKYFRKKMQTNMTDYILKLKIYHSKQDLLAGKSIGLISEEYSFSSDAHFVKTFKRYEGTTPGVYVKEFKNSEAEGINIS